MRSVLIWYPGVYPHMSETRLPVGATQGAIRMVLKTVNARRGLGVARFMFTFEVSSKQRAVTGNPVWLSGWVEVVETHGQVRPYLAAFQPSVQPLILPDLGVDQTLQLTLEITDRQLQLIEEHRSSGDVRLDIYLSGYAVENSQHVPVGESHITHQIAQSDWIGLLKQTGYRRLMILELEAPDPEAYPDLAEAIDYLTQAQHRYLEGEWRLTVESLRQALASLVGMKAEDEEQDIDVTDSMRTLRKESRTTAVGYEPRLELVRQATKFLCDLGAHPEIAETRRTHAYGALMMVGGLLQVFAKPV